jgi:hypothetical protein
MIVLDTDVAVDILRSHLLATHRNSMLPTEATS